MILNADGMLRGVAKERTSARRLFQMVRAPIRKQRVPYQMTSYIAWLTTDWLSYATELSTCWTTSFL